MEERADSRRELWERWQPVLPTLVAMFVGMTLFGAAISAMPRLVMSGRGVFSWLLLLVFFLLLVPASLLTPRLKRLHDRVVARIPLPKHLSDLVWMGATIGGMVIGFSLVPGSMGTSTFTPFCIGMLGFGLVHAGRRRRIGDALHCPKCGYEFAGDESSGPVRCPECATPWLGRLVKGRPETNRAMMAVGAAVIVLGGALIVHRLGVVTSFVAARTPTPWLTSQVVSAERPGGFMTQRQLWSELSSRTLTAIETEALAARLLDRRDRSGPLSGEAADWLHRAATAGRLASGLVDRFYSGLLRLNIVAPSSIKAGQAFTVRIVGDGELPSRGPMVVAWVESFGVERRLVVDGASRKWLSHYCFYPKLMERHSTDWRDGHGLPEIEERVSATGTARVRAVILVAVTNGPWSALPTVGQDGVWSPPPGIVWHQRLELEEEIKVLAPSSAPGGAR